MLSPGQEEGNQKGGSCQHNSGPEGDMMKTDALMEPQVAEEKNEEVNGQETTEVDLLVK